MKKILLGLGTLGTIVAPVAAVISCGDDSTPQQTNNNQAAATVATANINWPEGNTELAPAAKDSLKQMLNTAYNTANVQDIGDVVAYPDGLSTDDIEEDYAIGFSINKNVHIELGAWGYDFGKGGQIFITASKAGQIKFFVKTYSGDDGFKTHYITGSQKQFFIDLLKSRGFTFDHETVSSGAILANVVPTEATEATGSQDFDFTADLSKVGNFLSSQKTLIELSTLTGNSYTFEEMGIQGLQLSEGTTATCFALLDPHGNYMLDARGSITINVTLIHNGQTTTKENVHLAPMQLRHDLSIDAAAMDGKTFTTSDLRFNLRSFKKPVAKFYVGISYNKLTLHLKEELPPLSNGVTVTFEFMEDENHPGFLLKEGEKAIMKVILHYRDHQDESARIKLILMP